jgi:hypothetical protein
MDLNCFVLLGNCLSHYDFCCRTSGKKINKYKLNVKNDLAVVLITNKARSETLIEVPGLWLQVVDA